MVLVILEIMTSYCMVIQIQIRKEVSQIEKALQEDVSVWVSHDPMAKQEAIHCFS